MKKIAAFLLAAILLLLLAACGSGTAPGGSAGDEGTAADNDAAEGSTFAAADNSGSDSLAYDDLTKTEHLFVWPSDGDSFSYEIGCPAMRFDAFGWGMGSENSLSYSLVVAHPGSPAVNADISLEDAFLALLNGEDGYHAILKSIDSADYGEVTPEMETVTLENGSAAIRFNGIQKQDDYGDMMDCPIYGYCILVGNVPVIVSYILFDPADVDADTVADLAHYVDEMVNTVRISGE